MVLNHFHASDYIFIMTPWETLSQSNNGSSIIKQLPLIVSFILEYIYIYIYIYVVKKTDQLPSRLLPIRQGLMDAHALGAAHDVLFALSLFRYHYV